MRCLRGALLARAPSPRSLARRRKNSGPYYRCRRWAMTKHVSRDFSSPLDSHPCGLIQSWIVFAVVMLACTEQALVAVAQVPLEVT